jgi:hypothetical protein
LRIAGCCFRVTLQQGIYVAQAFVGQGILFRVGCTLSLVKGSILRLSKGSILRLSKGSILRLSKGSILRLSKGSILRLSKGSILRLSKGSILSFVKDGILSDHVDGRLVVTQRFLPGLALAGPVAGQSIVAGAQLGGVAAVVMID